MLRLNLHFALLLFSFSFIDYFGPAYLLKLGYAIHQVTAYWMFFFALRLVYRPLLVRLAHYLGLRHALILGVTLFSLRYFIYAELKDHPSWLIPLLLYESCTSTLYWLIYHSTFASLSSEVKTGGQVAWREVAVHLVKLASPISAAIIVNNFGFFTAFICAMIISISSLIPLIGLKLPQSELPDLDWRSVLKTDKAGFWIFGTSGIHEYGHNFIWKIVLFLYIGSYIQYGGLLSLAVFFQIVGSLMVGKRFDKGLGRRGAVLGLACMMTVLLSRSSLDLSITLIITLDFIFMLGAVLSGPYSAAVCYARSKRSGNPLWFQSIAETGWDLGAIMVLAAITTLLMLEVTLRTTILVGIVGILGLARALRRYGARPS